MRRNDYLWTSGVNLDTAVRFADPDFLLECKISAIWRRFPWIFAFYILNVRHISTSGFLTYWPRKYTTRVDTHVDNSHQVCSWYVHTLPSYNVFLSADTSRDLDLLTLNSGSAWRVSKNATKLEDPTPIRSWFMRYNVSHWLTLKIRTRPLRMCRITWPVSMESKTITFLECSTPIRLFTMQRRWLYDENN